MSNRRIRKKQQKAASATTSPATNQDQLLYIIDQVAAAHAYRDQLRAQGPGPASRASHTSPPSGPRAPTAAATAKNAAATAKEQQGQQRKKRLLPIGIARSINNALGKLGGPASRGPATSAMGKFHDNLAELPLTPLIIVIIVIALILLPVFQGYTRLDLLFMVLSGDASMPIPVRGAGQNYHQAQTAPPVQNGTGGVGGAIWGGIANGIAGGVAGIAPALPTIIGIAGGFGLADTQPPIPAPTPAPSPFAPGGQTWLD